MKPLYVFYHFYSKPEHDHTKPEYNWTWPLDQQLQAIRNSGLSTAAKINMCITGWVDLDYINLRYPFVNVINTRNIDEPNIFEGQTLELLWGEVDDLPDDACILYMHNKGTITNAPPVAAWRETLINEMITKWESCVPLLNLYDVVAVSDSHVLNSNSVITSGNFWWSTAKYLKTLPDPIDSTKYLNTCHPGDIDYRYCFERWITTNKPHTYYTCNMNLNPYIEYYFIEEHN